MKEKRLAWVGEAAAEKPAPTRPKGNRGTGEVPKYQTCEPQTVRLLPGQWAAVGELRRRIMAARSAASRREGERITDSTLARVALQALCSLDIDVEEIPDEAELARRVLEKCSTGGVTQ